MLHAVSPAPEATPLPHRTSSGECWYVYMVRCNDGTLYSGIAKNLEKRLNAHNHGKNGARYTKSRRPVELVYQEAFPCRSAAARREYELKKMSRELKLQLAGKAAAAGCS